MPQWKMGAARGMRSVDIASLSRSEEGTRLPSKKDEIHTCKSQIY